MTKALRSAARQRRAVRGVVAGIVLGLGLWVPAAFGEARPNIYGCGIVWGNWLGLTGEADDD